MNRLFRGLLLVSLFHFTWVYGQTIHKDHVQFGSLNFVPNQGQIADRNGQPRPDVLFQVEGKGVFLREKGITYVFSNRGAVRKEIDREIAEKMETDSEFKMPNKLKLEAELWKDKKVKVHQIDMDFLNANQQPKTTIFNESSDYLNSYYPHCPNGVLGIKLCKKIAYENVYNGIDVIFYGQNQSDLKYDLIVQPYANPNQIQLLWKGADTVFIDDQGRLVIENQVETLYESLPHVYQFIQDDTVSVSASYTLFNRENGDVIVSFALAEYDKSFPLVIDPWITNYGGDELEIGEEVTTDLYGNVYLSGASESAMSIAESGFQLVHGGGLKDAFLAKFNPEGTRLWATYYGGNGDEIQSGVAVDQMNNVYLGGSTGSNVGISFAGHQNTFGGFYDGYLVKFDEDGARIWATYYGGTSDDYGYNVGVDANDNVFLCGFTSSESAIFADGHQAAFGGFYDSFLVKFDSAGNRVWGTYYGGANAEILHDIATDDEGNVFVSGITTSPDLISSVGSYQEVFGGGQDAFLVKFDPDGLRLWGTYYGGLWVERGDAVAVDTAGNVYAAGKTTAPSGMASPGAFQITNGGISDAFLAKFNSTGDRLWGTYIGGDMIDYAFSVDVDKTTNNCVVVGETYSPDFPVSLCASQPFFIGTRHAFVTQFFSDGELFCSSYFGSSFEIESVGALNNCEIYVAGSCTTAVATPGAHQTVYGGENDAYLAQLHTSYCGLVILETTEIATSKLDVTSCTPCNGSARVDIADFCMHPRALKSYKWSNGFEELYTTNLTSINDTLCEGEYWVEVTVNCDVIDTFFFEIGNSASISAGFSYNNVCVGEVVDFENTSTTTFGTIVSNDWDFGDGNTDVVTDPSHVYDEPGTYMVTLVVINDSECIDSITQIIEVFPVFDLIYDTLVCKFETLVLPNGESVIIEADTNFTFDFITVNGCDSTINVSVSVVFTDQTSQDIYLEEPSFVTYPDGEEEFITANTVHVSNFINSFGCDSILTTHVYLIEKPDPPVETYFLQPNVFSPGSDQANNTFFFPHKGVESFQCVIVNRWGVEVFRFNSIADTWDGINVKTGKDCMDGVYFYTYAGSFSDGEIFEGQGTVQLVRE